MDALVALNYFIDLRPHQDVNVAEPLPLGEQGEGVHSRSITDTARMPPSSAAARDEARRQGLSG